MKSHLILVFGLIGFYHCDLFGTCMLSQGLNSPASLTDPLWLLMGDTSINFWTSFFFFFCQISAILDDFTKFWN